MLVQLPSPTQGNLFSYITALYRSLTTAFASVISSSQAAPRLILQDSNGKVWVYTANTDGTLNVGDRSTLPKNL